tara:strand:- start:549 stop:809 length:261 start_codon:yes stop_codon:yes gene_type:complete
MAAERGVQITTQTLVQWLAYALFMVVMALVGFGVRSIQGDVTEIKAEIHKIDLKQESHLTNHPSHQLFAEIAVLQTRVQSLEANAK